MIYIHIPLHYLMMQIEAEKTFTTKLNKNSGSLIITVPHSIVIEYDLISDEWIEMAYVKKIDITRGKKKAR